MKPLTSPKRIQDIMNLYGMHFSKKWGQNFLIEQNIVENIVRKSGVTKNDMVLEIGAGIGALTYELSKYANKVLSVEIDKKLIPILSDTLSDCDNVAIEQGDILKVDLNKLIDKYLDGKIIKVVANLPYYVTTPIIMKFLEEDINVSSLTVMIQKEVAQRLVAEPNTKDYGALSVMAQYRAGIQILMDVPPTAFMPRPKVTSSVVKLDKKNLEVEVLDEKIFFKTVKSAFMKRRKTLKNSLSTGLLDITKEEVEKLLSDINIDAARRAETLAIEEFISIANGIYKINK